MFPELHFFSPTVMISQPFQFQLYMDVANRQVISVVKLWDLKQVIMFESHIPGTNLMTFFDIQFHYFKYNIVHGNICFQESEKGASKIT